ncbi:MAG: hypothetical protein ACNI3H_10185 [Halarcobacter ebronensis]|uniref:AbiU2 domain-containing protein n=1 Tax=Halarcobacter ebronensis TaxID=1462615 RepID=UPI003C7261EE
MDINELENNFQKCLNDFFNKVYRQWYIYNYLFSSKENVEILNSYENKIIMTLFQNSVSDSIILGIQRILDDTKNSKKINLTLHYFKQNLSKDTEKKIFGNKIKEIEVKFEKYKEYRHKKLGHSAAEYNGNILIDEDIEIIIKKIIEIFNDYIEIFNFNENKKLCFDGGIKFENKFGKDIVNDFIEDINSLTNKSHIYKS